MSNDARRNRARQRVTAGARVGAFVVAAIVALAASPSSGQAQLTEVFQGLFDYGHCHEPLCLNVDASPGHGDHFIASRVQGANNILSFIQSSLSAGLASLPVASATSGVTFEFNSQGLPVETQVSPGPVFAERAQTLGAGRVVLND